MVDEPLVATNGRRSAWPLVLAAVVGLIAWGLLATLGRHSFFPNADSAASILAGRALTSGNVFLRHWHLPLDSYWTEELVLFGIATRIAGLSLTPAWAVPAAVTVALGFLVAKLARAGDVARGVASVATVATIVFVLVPIGLPSLVAATFGLQGPTHLTTLALCLVVFVLLTPGRSNGARVAGVAVLGVALVGDPIALVLGAVPVVLGGLVQGIRRRQLRVAATTIAEVGGAVIFAGVLRLVTIAAGGYRIAPLQPSAARGRWLANLHMVPHFVDLLFGSALSTPRVWAGPTVVLVTRTVAEAVFVVAVAIAFALAIARLVRRHDTTSPGDGWVDDVVLAALLCDIGFFVVAAVPPVDINSIRYLLPLLPLAGIVTARTLPRMVRHAGSFGTAISVLAASAVLVGGAVGYRHQVAPRRPMALQSDVARWLQQHRMSEGISGYWDAAPITLLTKGRVRLRAAEFDGRRLVGFTYLADDRAVPRDRGPLNFVLASGPDRTGNVTTATAIATFGAPASRVDIGQFTILVWNRDLSTALNVH